MIIRKEIVMILMIFVLVLKAHSQNKIKALNNEVFKSKIGSICEEIPEPNPCAGQEIYLFLKFNKKKLK